MSHQDTPSDPRRMKHVALALAALIPTTPNVIYFCLTPSRYWAVQWVTSLLIGLSPLLLGAKVRTTIVLLLPFALFTPFACAYAVATGYPPSILAMQVLREATVEEFSNYSTPLLLCLLASMAIALLYVQVIRETSARSRALPRAARFAMLAVLIVLLTKDILVQGFETGKVILLARLERQHPIAPLVILVQLNFGDSIVSDRRIVLKHYRVVQRPPLDPDEICVLIIGESARRDAFGLYNPDLLTTPRLQKRNLVVFRDTLSCGTATIQSVPILLTGHFPDHGEILPFRHLGLVEAFRLAGFHTAWLSTQEADGQISSFITPFSKNAQQKFFFNGRMEHAATQDPVAKFDGAMLQIFRQILRNKNSKTFVVLHTLGSHLPYPRRYPAEFEHWPVSPNARASMRQWLPPFSPDQQEQINHAYFNTVFYTDWFIDSIIADLEKSGRVSALIYISDHGENKPSAPLMPASHAVLTADVVNVPFLVWLSPALQAHKPGLSATLSENARLPVSSEDVFSTLCDVFNLDTPEADSTKSLASRNYRPHVRRVLLLDDSIATPRQ